MVAAHGGQRNARGSENLRRRREAGIPERLRGLDLSGQVAVQADEIGLLLRSAADQQAEDRVARMDVVDDPEIDLLLRRIERCDGVGLVFEDVAAESLVEDDALVAFVEDDAPLHDAVTVGRAGFQSADAHAVHASDALASEVRIAEFRTFGGIEVRTVVRGQLHPSGGIRRRTPYDGEAFVGHVQQIGAVLHADAGLCGSCGRRQEEAQQQDRSFHSERGFVRGSKVCFYFLFSNYELEKPEIETK